jgi:hypothetical protein
VPFMLARFHSVSSLVRLVTLQLVSTPRSLAFGLLTYLSFCALQLVSTPRSFSFLSCPHLSVALRSPGREYPSLFRFLSVFVLIYRSALSSW